MRLEKLREVYKATEKQPHRFVSLEVNEVSLVNDAAIITEEEAKQGAGFVVLKMADTAPVAEAPAAPAERTALYKAAKAHFQESVRKFLKDGEDLFAVLDLLMEAAIVKLSVALNDRDIWWDVMPIKVTTTEVVMVDLTTASWGHADPTTTIYYKVPFTRDDAGAFTTGEPVKMMLEFRDVDSVTKYLTPTEKAMKLKGIKVGGEVLTLKIAPGAEFKLGETVVVKVAENGDHTLAEGFTLNADGIVEKASPPSEPAPTPPPVAETAKAAEPAKPDITALLETMRNSGEAMTLKFGADGSLEVSRIPGQSQATPMPVAKSTADELTEAKARVSELEAQVLKHAQEKNGASPTSEVPAQPTTTVTTKAAKAEGQFGHWTGLLVRP